MHAMHATRSWQMEHARAQDQGQVPLLPKAAIFCCEPVSYIPAVPVGHRRTLLARATPHLSRDVPSPSHAPIAPLQAVAT
jgi:hypothetical protein